MRHPGCPGFHFAITLLLLIPFVGCSTEKGPEAIEGKPLLEQGDHVFQDDQVGLRFTPPANWSMQERSTQAPRVKKEERVLVKYRRMIEGLDPAYLKVSIANVDEGVPLNDLLVRRRPDVTWQLASQVQSFEHKGLPAARITFQGFLNMDQTEARSAIMDITAIRRGQHVFFFTGAYTAVDPKGPKRIKTAVESVEFY